MTKEEAVSIIEERIRVTEYVESSYVDCVDIEALRIAIKALAQPEPEIYWGYTPTYERPLADREIIPRLRDIQKQIPGGSYAIDRAIEIIEVVAERRTNDTSIG